MTVVDELPLVNCQRCGQSIPRPRGKSWPQYRKRKYCSKSCLGAERQGHPVAYGSPVGHRLGGQIRPVTVELDWQADAACRRTGVDRELFFHPDGERGPTGAQHRERQALAVCVDCPVRSACLRHALAVPESYGVWGGMTEAQRRTLRARNR